MIDTAGRVGRVGGTMKTVLAIFILALTGIFCLLSSPCSAYCVYNHTNANFDVCGESCNKCFRKNIKSGHHACCPGGHKGCGGHTYITFHPYEGRYESNYGWYAPVQVTNHGWVSFFGKCKGSMMLEVDVANPDYCKDVTVKVHNNDGDVIYHGGLYRANTTWYGDIKCKDD
jgi:hypothetical protein